MSKVCKAPCSSKKGACKKRTLYDSHCWIHGVNIDGVRIKKSTIPAAGKGLYAARDFRKGEKVCTYEGRNISEQTVNARSDDRNRFVENIQGGRCLDAWRKTSCYGRMINSYHGMPKSKMNVKIMGPNVARAQATKLNVKAIKQVKKGQEFFTTYGGPGGWYAGVPEKRRKRL
jgi:hypothetical protein